MLKEEAVYHSGRFFQSAVLDMSVLSIAIVNRSDVFADDPEYTPASYHKAYWCEHGVSIAKSAEQAINYFNYWNL